MPQLPPACLQSIIKSYRQAALLAVEHIRSHAVSLEGKSDAEKRDLLTKCASTSLNSKLVRGGTEARWRTAGCTAARLPARCCTASC